MLRFSVSDTGIGVPREQHEAIFLPFVQADGSTTREYGGTGLGLPICRKLVGLLGGNLWLQSEPGRGSRFHFTIRVDLVERNESVPTLAAVPPAPRIATAVTAAPAVVMHAPGTVPAPRSPRPLRILLAEDNKVNQLLASRLLERRGHTVQIAGSGEEALAAVANVGSAPFDLLVLEMQMFDMDGFAITAIVRAREELSGQHLLTIALAVQGIGDEQQRQLTAGLDGWVASPIQVEELFATIDNLIH